MMVTIVDKMTYLNQTKAYTCEKFRVRRDYKCERLNAKSYSTVDLRVGEMTTVSQVGRPADAVWIVRGFDLECLGGGETS